MVETKATLPTLPFSTYKMKLCFHDGKQNKNIIRALKIYNNKKVPITNVWMVKTNAAQPTLTLLYVQNNTVFP